MNKELEHLFYKRKPKHLGLFGGKKPTVLGRLDGKGFPLNDSDYKETELVHHNERIEPADARCGDVLCLQGQGK